MVSNFWYKSGVNQKDLCHSMPNKKQDQTKCKGAEYEKVSNSCRNWNVAKKGKEITKGNTSGQSKFCKGAHTKKQNETKQKCTQHRENISEVSVSCWSRNIHIQTAE
jgi:hypothetical protein